VASRPPPQLYSMASLFPGLFWARFVLCASSSSVYSSPRRDAFISLKRFFSPTRLKGPINPLWNQVHGAQSFFQTLSPPRVLPPFAHSFLPSLVSQPKSHLVPKNPSLLPSVALLPGGCAYWSVTAFFFLPLGSDLYFPFSPFLGVRFSLPLFLANKRSSFLLGKRFQRKLP